MKAIGDVRQLDRSLEEQDNQRKLFVYFGNRWNRLQCNIARMKGKLMQKSKRGLAIFLREHGADKLNKISLIIVYLNPPE